MPEVEVKDHPGDIRSFELHNPTIPNYPITLVAHKDPVKAYWLKEIRQYASDLVALAEHAADDLQVTEEVPETKEELKSDEKPVSIKVEQQANPISPKVQVKEEIQANPISPKVQAKEEVKANPLKIDSIKDSTKVVEKKKDSVIDISEAKKTKVEEVQVKEEAKANPGPPKVDSIKDSKVVEKRKDSATNISETKKTKVEEAQANMSRRYSASRYSTSSKVVEGKLD